MRFSFLKSWFSSIADIYRKDSDPVSEVVSPVDPLQSSIIESVRKVSGADHVGVDTSLTAPLLDGGLGLDDLDYANLLNVLESELGVTLTDANYADTVAEILENIGRLKS